MDSVASKNSSSISELDELMEANVLGLAPPPDPPEAAIVVDHNNHVDEVMV